MAAGFQPRSFCEIIVKSKESDDEAGASEM